MEFNTYKIMLIHKMEFISTEICICIQTICVKLACRMLHNLLIVIHIYIGNACLTYLKHLGFIL